MIKYRWLSPTEYDTLSQVFAENEGELPDPNLSAIRVAINENNEIVGFAALQLVPHLEPVWIRDDHRGKVNWREFQTAIEGLFDNKIGGSYYTFPGNDRVAKMCKRAGMTEVPMKAWKKDV